MYTVKDKKAPAPSNNLISAAIPFVQKIMILEMHKQRPLPRVSPEETGTKS